MSVLLVWHLYDTQQYLFAFREQLMVFYYDLSIVMQRYSGIGGFSLMSAHYLTQFFRFPFIGALVTAFLGILSTFCLWRSLPRRYPTLLAFALCLMPVIFQCHSLFDVYYSYQGLVAYTLFTVFVYIQQRLSHRFDDSNKTLLSGCLLALVLFYLAGAVAFLFTSYIFIISLIENPRSSWRMLLPILVVVMLGGFSINYAWLPTWRYAVTNGAYYEPIIEPTLFFQTSWIITCLIPLFTPLLSFAEARMRQWMNVASLALLFILIALFTIRSANRNQQRMYPMIVMDYHIVRHDWKGLLSTPSCDSSNFLMMNRVNLALSKQGRLLDDFFHYPQMMAYSIMTELDNLSLDVEITSTICEIYYQMNNIASADERAFNSYEGLRFGSPSNLQMLVRTSLIFGRYQLAEKFIGLLEKTLYYKDLATQQRGFLYNDEAVLADAEYGPKRRSLPEKDSRTFIQAQGPYFDLLTTLRVSPESQATRDYAIAYLLLANDIPHINAFVEEFYNTPVMPKTPLRLQEAYLAANEKDLDLCRAHGVEEKTINEYQRLKKTMLDARSSGMNPGPLMQEWRYTYWYYLLITSPNLARMREEMQQQESAKQGKQSIM